MTPVTYLLLAVAVVGFFLLIFLITTVGRQRRDAAWKKLANELEAQFIPGGLFRSSKVQAHIKQWTVTLDSYSVSDGDSQTSYTRIKAPFQNRDGFEFRISRMGLVAKLEKVLGHKTIDLSDPELARDFVLQGNNESKAQTLFANQKIREFIQSQKSMTLWVKGNELSFETQGVLRDVGRLKSLFELFAAMLEQLES